jgi:hypothetical protein
MTTDGILIHYYCFSQPFADASPKQYVLHRRISYSSYFSYTCPPPDPTHECEAVLAFLCLS